MDVTLVTRSPEGALRAFVEALIGVDAPSFPLVRSLPKSAVELFISVGGHAWISGAREHVLDMSPGRAAFVAVRFTPGGFSALFGTPAAEFSNRVEALPEAGGEVSIWADQARDAVELPSLEARLAALESALLRRLSRSMPRDEPILASIDAQTQSGGQIAIRTLCERFGVSRRHLMQGYADAVGFSPKRYAELLRFQTAARLVREGVPLGDLSSAAGYFDQAHLSNDFRRRLRETPVAFRQNVGQQLDPWRFAPRIFSKTSESGPADTLQRGFFSGRSADDDD